MVMLVRLILSYSDILELFTPDWLYNILNLIYIAFMMYKIVVLQTYSNKSIKAISALMAVVLATFVTAKYNTFLLTMFAVIAVQNVDLKKVLTYTYRFKTVFLVINTLLYIVICFVNPSMVTFDYRMGDLTTSPRHNFMLGHANIASMFVAWTTLEYMYCNLEKLNWKKVVGLWAVNFLAFLFTDSQSSIIVITVASAVIILESRNNEKVVKAIDFLSRYFFMICSILFPIICMVYTSLSGTALTIWESINELLSGRLIYGACAYKLSGVAWLGKSIPYMYTKTYWYGHWFDQMVFDNSYILFFVSNGYIVLLLLAILFILSGRVTTREDKIFLFVYAVYFMMETYVLNSIFCFAIIILGKVFFEKNDTAKSKHNNTSIQP
jgi:hypothetical protein